MLDLRRLRLLRELARRGTITAVAEALSTARPQCPSSSLRWRRRPGCACSSRPAAGSG